MRSHVRWFLVILLLVAFAVWVSLPTTLISNVPESCYGGSQPRPKPEQGLHLDFNSDCDEDFTINVRQALGLDLVGGLRVLLQAELPPGSFTVDDLRLAANNVEKR